MVEPPSSKPQTQENFLTRAQLWVRTLQYVTDQGVPTGLRFVTAHKVFKEMEFLLDPSEQRTEQRL